MFQMSYNSENEGGDKKEDFVLPKKVIYMVAYLSVISYRTGCLSKLSMLASLIADGTISSTPQALGKYSGIIAHRFGALKIHEKRTFRCKHIEHRCET